MFEENLKPTISAAFRLKSMVFNGVEHEMQFWDTAGEEKFRSLAPIYVQNASLAIIVFDVTNEQSYNELNIWIDVSQSSGKIPFIVLGNKNDLENRIGTSEAFNTQIKEKFDAPYIDCSAKTCEGVELVLQQALTIIDNQSHEYTVKEPVMQEKKKEKCC
ncbi:Ras family protein [Trichomonas vaginalis G3]|uniref:Ras family protein n=1 Tax=Trichomonas vaginalis (strain ATCC PRA-98 / G3) TaxID=412133 RepID=A2EAJ5_TRIV3|nr:GTPase protein [Trichomonas vaginalis G3]EAY10306.1 Ras family protein [Trichomonas vaginalis G3]KAI5491023.1 GTPase protein [Trichomonas vaginalis G3]|eukprot:XP_001322529.1 Ras family protein [Trichomonas vaginalis G3]